MTSTTHDDTPVTIAGEGLEARTREMGGGMSVLWVRAAKGTDLGPALKGLPDDLCQCPHWGFLTKGRIKLRTAEGEETYEAGQLYYWPPGHAPEALEDSEFAEFCPTKELEEVIAHVKAQMT
ncbi:hypothetical protein J1792_29845 [Streptomyces triculaminicus]|uniref:Cupin domain-containing protein n=2 Tax=Streptomyces TaxID=1883 RepID=A0A939FT00_9ACTN|nr:MULTISPECIES: hypothetical protein [Streptomyces]MBO0656792.1 hypothetical protein [Streptomyces triculaminicus]QSY47775.1 hypothetical protein J3S04_21230 [Streptomyces griseocarneus]